MTNATGLDSDSFRSIQEKHASILACMALQGVKKAEVSYDGYDGCTYMGMPDLLDSAKQRIEGNEFEPLSELIQEFAEMVADACFPEFNKIGEGGRGELVVNADKGTVTLKHKNLDLVKGTPTEFLYDLNQQSLPFAFPAALRLFLPSLRKCGVDYLALSYDGTNNEGSYAGPNLYAGDLKALSKIARDGNIGDPVEGWNKKVSPVAGRALNCLDRMSYAIDRARLELAPGFDDAEGSTGFMIIDVQNETLIHEHALYSREGKKQVIKFDAPLALANAPKRPRP